MLLTERGILSKKTKFKSINFKEISTNNKLVYLVLNSE